MYIGDCRPYVRGASPYVSEADMPEGNGSGSELIRVPKWTLLFIIPAVGMLGMAARNELITNDTSNRFSRFLERYDEHLERDHESDRTRAELEQRVRWLCAQHARQTASDPLAGECP